MADRIEASDVKAVLARKRSGSTRLAELVRDLGLPKTRRRDVRRVLGELIDRGSVEQVSRHRFRLAANAGGRDEARQRGPAPRRGLDTAETRGWLWVHPRGFGFVTPEDGGSDVFVPAAKRSNALHGDRVRLRAWDAERGREGRIVEVLERGARRVAGRLTRRGRHFGLEPEDARLPQPIEVVGSLPLGIRAGDEVVAGIDRYPERRGDGLRVRVLGALGPRGSAAAEIEKIEIREGIEEEFARAALAEAQSFGSRIPRSEIRVREDLRGLALVTIDPSDARDHDDAVYGEALPEGGYRIVVAIADVSHYVQAGSALDRAAFARGTSIYLPDRVVPMLPFELSSQLASLVPGEDRLALAIEVELGPRGAVRRHRYVEAVVRSHARLSYEGVARALHLSEQTAPQHEAETRRDLLEVLWEASQLLRARRRRRGSLEFELPEAAIELDDQGEPTDIRRARSDPGLRQAYGMIEDLMLLANEVVAGDLARRGLPTIYRIHGAPDEERVARFAELAASLGYALDADAASKPRKLAEFLRSVEGTDHAQALHFLLLRAMQQATYDTRNLGHFALAARSYLHFTSPIRRYPDLAVHRIVRAVIRGARLDREAIGRMLTAQAASASRLERRAQAIDREVAHLYGALLLRDRIGETFDATITSLDAAGLWLTLDRPFVEARCPIESLGREGYALDALGLELRAPRSGHVFTLGDRLTVHLDSVSIPDRSVTVHIDGHLPSDRGRIGPDRPRRRSEQRPRRGEHRGRNQPKGRSKRRRRR